MKLVKINPDSARKGVATIRIYKQGPMAISAELVRSLKLNDKSELAFYQDEDEPMNWYLKIEKGLKIRFANHEKTSFMINSASIVRRMMESCKLADKSIMLVGTEPIEGGYHAIITSSAKIPKK